MPRPYGPETCYLRHSSEELLFWYIRDPVQLHSRTDEAAKLKILLVLLGHGETEIVYVCENIIAPNIDLYHIHWLYFLVYATPFYF